MSDFVSLNFEGLGVFDVHRSLLDGDEATVQSNMIRARRDIEEQMRAQQPVAPNAGTLDRGIAEIQQGISTTLRRTGLPGADTVAPDPSRLQGRSAGEVLRGDFFGNLGRIPGLITESLPDLAAAWASMKAGAAVGGMAGPGGALIGGIAGPVLYTAARALGPRAEQSARNNGRAEPNAEDWARAAAAVGVEGVSERVGLSGSGLRRVFGEGASEAIGGAAGDAAVSVGTEAGIEAPTPSSVLTDFTGGAGARGVVDVGAGAARAIGATPRVVTQGIADFARAADVRNMDDAQITSDLRVLDAYRRRRAAEEQFQTNPGTDASVTFKSVMDDYRRAIEGLADAQEAAGLIDRDQRRLIDDAIREARQHNREAAENAGMDYFTPIRDRVRAIGLDPRVEAALLDGLRDLNTATYNGFYKNRRGPFEAIGRNLAGPAVAGLGGAAIAPPYGALLALAGRGAGAAVGRSIDRMAGTNVPDVVARSRVLRRVADERGLSPGNLAPEITALTNRSRRRAQATQTQRQQQAAQYNAQANQLGLVRGGGWAPAITQQANSIAPGIVDIEDPLRAVEDLARMGAIDQGRADALINDRTQRPNEAEMRLITDYVVTAATQANRSSWNQPTTRGSAPSPNPPVAPVRNQAAYDAKMSQVQVQNQQIMDAVAGDPAAQAVAQGVVNAKSRADKEAAFGQGTGNPQVDALLRTTIDSTSARSGTPASSTSVVGPEGRRARLSAARPGVGVEGMGRDPTARVARRAGAQQGIQEDGRRAKVDRGEGRSVLPAPQRWLGPDAKEGPFQGDRARPFTKGGTYLVKTPEGFQDITGTTVNTATIEVVDGKPQFRISNTDATRDRADGPLVKTNLYKRKAGWKWVEGPKDAPETIVSVEHGSKHNYALRTDFEVPVQMSRYENAPSEPRLRPSANGVVRLGNIVGYIEARGYRHPVYDRIEVVSKRDQGQPALTQDTTEVSARDFTPEDLESGNQVLPEDFLRILNSNEGGSTLTQYDPEEFQRDVASGKIRLYKAPGRDAVFAIKQGEDYSWTGATHPSLAKPHTVLVAVANNDPALKHWGESAARLAADMGVTALDAFAVKNAQAPEGILPRIYGKAGFRTVATVPFDPSFYDADQLANLEKFWDRQKWDRDTGRPSLAVMVHEDALGPLAQSDPAENIRALVDKDLLQASLVDDLYGPNGIQKKDNLKVRKIGELLQSRWKGEPLTDYTPENREKVARLMAFEAAKAVQADNSAIGWYDGKVRETLSMAAEKYPEIRTDPEASLAMTFAMAVTSNGTAVDTNMNSAMRVYEQWRDNGRTMPDFGTGKAANVMQASFSLWNQWVQRRGIKDFSDFLFREFTVGELNKTMKDLGIELEITGENMDTKVFGAAVLGPKIGNGFFMNLNGRFDQLTMDMWWMRMWGRMTGDLIPELTPETRTKRRDRLEAAILAEGAKGMQRFGKDLPEGFKPTKAYLRSLDDEGLLAVADRIEAWASRNDWDRTGPIDPKTGKKKPSEVSSAAKRWNEGFTALNEQPVSGGHRNFMRSTAQRALEILRENGIDISAADFQAVLWYPEQRLYQQVYGRGRGTDTDYAKAIRKILANGGLSEDQLDRAVERGFDFFRL